MDFEKLGQFYLGGLCDPATGECQAEQPLLYDSRDLTTHAVCLGMTGSGKTGLCLSLLEEAAIDGIPALCIDPKGDLGNLLLTFPALAAEDFQPWVDAGEASRQGLDIAEFAEKTANQWREGLAAWGQSGARIQRLRDAAELTIYTPASTAGRPLTVLKSFAAPAAHILQDPELLRDRLTSAAAGLLGLLRIDADPITSREHILLCSLLEHAWRNQQSVDMGSLIRMIQTPPFSTVGFLDLESFFPQAERFRLAMTLNNVLASPGFSAWLQGEALDIQSLLYTPSGKPRIAILSIAHLSDAERMFFVTILLNEVVAWMRSQTGTSSLRALLYMDEVFGYFPPNANPSSKLPMLTLLKQARAFGLGVVLATQNPVDLDYKGLANCGTWFLGRLQTDRDRQRVLEGLEGAAASTGTAFDRQQLDRLLGGLGKRMFLMKNVHEDEPVLFQTRWTLSYLRGPISRQQIERLMSSEKSVAPVTGIGSSTVPHFASPPQELARQSTRPMLPPGIPEYFLPPSTTAERYLYRPALAGQARVHFVDARRDVDVWETITLIRLAGTTVPSEPWEDADEWEDAELVLAGEPAAGAEAVYREYPGELAQKKSYTAWGSALKNSLYRNRRLRLFQAESLSLVSGVQETEGDFRVRLRQRAREERDLQVEKLRQKYGARLKTLTEKIQRAEQKIQKEKSQQSSKTLTAAVTLGTSLLGALMGRRTLSATNMSRAGTVFRSASSAVGEAGDVQRAEEQHAGLLQEQRELETLIEEESARIAEQYDPDHLPLTTLEITPRKADTLIDQVVLLWLPWTETSTGAIERAF